MSGLWLSGCGDNVPATADVVVCQLETDAAAGTRDEDGLGSGHGHLEAVLGELKNVVADVLRQALHEDVLVGVAFGLRCDAEEGRPGLNVACLVQQTK